MREVYLDYAAATPLDPQVKEAMEPYWSSEYGNPSSLHQPGQKAKEAVENARKTIAQILYCRSTEIIFTSGGTEAVNLGIFGVARGFGKGHIITSKIEHHAVLRPMEELEREGFEVTYLNVDQYGLVEAKAVKAALRPDTILVSIMYANNEIGVIEPIAEIGKIIREYRREKTPEAGSRKPEANERTPFFHSDACQAAGALDMNVEKLGIDLLAFGGSKIYGPKGIGCLYSRRVTPLKPLMVGGGQERGFRSGTENVPAIVGLAKAFEIAQQEKDKENARLIELRDYFIKRLTAEISGAVLNGHPLIRLHNNVNISIPGIEGEAAVLFLDAKRIYVSTGSACSSTSLEPSHVVLALGKSREYAEGSLRFTLGRHTTKDDVDYVMKVLPAIIQKLRQPFWGVQQRPSVIEQVI